VWLHRWVGLVIALFLVLAGLTGSLLAFYHELDGALNQRVMRVAPPTPDAPLLDPIALRAQIEQRYPGTWVHYVDLSPRAGHALTFYLESSTDPLTGAHAELPNDEVFVDPYTGAVLGERKWGDLGQGLTNLMPFVYRLHYALALGTIGAYVFGIVALLWTVDCFVSAVLTFPRRAAGGPGWFSRWRPAWGVRWTGGSYKLNFDLHRAGGLWLWAMLFVLAWSSVAFNLQEVYNPVMRTLFTHQPTVDSLVPKQRAAIPQPALRWHDAQKIGRAHMAALAQERGFEVVRESGLSYDPQRALYRYRVQSDRDVATRWGSTSVYFDATSGALRASFVPTGEAAGDTVTTWLLALHMAAVWGLPFKIFVCVMGLVVVLLSGTGIYIWWKKRGARASVATRGAGAERLNMG
jgi:uncharacterized iron-regulated membrane protein